MDDQVVANAHRPLPYQQAFEAVVAALGTDPDGGDRLTAHRAYIRAQGETLPETREWRWPNGRPEPS